MNSITFERGQEIVITISDYTVTVQGVPIDEPVKDNPSSNLLEGAEWVLEHGWYEAVDGFVASGATHFSRVRTDGLNIPDEAECLLEFDLSAGSGVCSGFFGNDGNDRARFGRFRDSGRYSLTVKLPPNHRKQLNFRAEPDFRGAVSNISLKNSRKQ